VVIAKESEDKRNAIIAEHAQLMSTLGAQAEKMKEEMAVLTDSIAQYTAK
jgi:phage host-nuclease inhibitor protein Gam